MPLPNVTESNRCTARTKSRNLEPCKNIRAYQCKTCKMHGARKKETILTGKNHPNFKHGKTTQEALAENNKRLRELRDIEQVMVTIGVHTGGLMKGRKPRSN